MNAGIENEDVLRAQRVEHGAWKRMFTKMAETFNVNTVELNDQKYRPLFEEIERWAYFDRIRRNVLKKNNMPYSDSYGLFYKGE